MKLISKFLTVAAFATALASCTDDLESAYSGNFDGDMHVTLEQFNDQMTRLAAQDNKNPYGLEGLVFSKDELVRVFTLDKLSQDIYKLKSGAGTFDGIFERTQATGLTGQKYAITEAQFVYGISAAEDGDAIKPRLTMTLPLKWTPGSETINGTDFQKFPVPYWGAAEVVGEGDDAQINASLKALTAYLRIQVNELPAGTKYLVLTTHGTAQYNLATPDGFMLAKHDAAITDTKDWWYKYDETAKEYVNAQQILGGYSEALTGTLNCFLEADNTKAKDVYLKIDERLVNHDEMIIDLTSNKNQIVYVPIVCGEYKNLHVIAASAISEKYRYCYAGTELKVFQDQTFERGKPYYLNMNLVDLGEASIAHLNQQIEALNVKQGMTTIFNVDLKKETTIYKYKNNNDCPDNRIYIQGPGSVILNINSIASEYKELYEGDAANKATKALEISDKNATKGRFNEVSGEAPFEINNNKQGLHIRRSVVVNFPSKWGDGDADLDAWAHVDLATYTAILGTSDREKAAKLSVDVLGPNTKLNETIELQYNDGEKVNFNKEALDNETQYAIRVKEGFKNVNVIRGNLGDLFVHTDGLQAIGETEVDSLDIQDQENINIRLQDALIGAFKFSKTTSTKSRNVFTLGSTAIKKVYNSTTDAVDAPGNLFKKADIEKNGTDYAGDDTNTPHQVGFRAYWTGAALSEYAIKTGYDVETVYTAAQLASVGEGLVTSTNSNHGIGEAVVEPKIQSYYIPKALVRGVWLGDNIYPWIGAQATVKHFAFDGEEVELKNMTFLEDWAGASTYIDDPHWCCTSCWKPDITGSTIKIGDNIGLFRSVINSDSVLITRINLNDVKLVDETNKHNNVGAIVGKIDAAKTYMLYNTISENKISMNGDSIGGMAGYIKSSEKLIVKYNDVLGNTNNSGYVKSKLEYVGGAIGYAGGLTDTVAITNNNVIFDNATVSTISGLRDVAGFVGNLTAKCPITVLDNNIVVTGNIEATGKFTAGGFAGHIDNKPSAKKEIIMNNNKVTVTKGDIKAAQHQAAGMVGRYDVKKSPITMLNDIVSVETGSIIAGTNYAGGLIAHLHSDENVTLGDVIDDKVSVSVKTKIQAKDKFAGGLVGWSELEGKSDTLLVLSADVTTPIVEAINGYVGGEIGQGAMGTYIFGADYDTFHPSSFEYFKYEQNINISKYLSGKYAVGGVLGNNASSSATPVYVLTGKTDHTNGYSHIVVNVKSFNQTKKYTDFDANEKNMFGTVSNILGYMQDDIYFSGTKANHPDGPDTDYYLDVTDNLTGELKTALLFKYHGGQTHTDVDDPTKQLFWGDTNGLVGFRLTGTYFLEIKDNPNEALKSRGEGTDVPLAHNLYRTNGEGGATYNSYKSILQ